MVQSHDVPHHRDNFDRFFSSSRLMFIRRVSLLLAPVTFYASSVSRSVTNLLLQTFHDEGTNIFRFTRKHFKRKIFLAKRLIIPAKISF